MMRGDFDALTDSARSNIVVNGLRHVGPIVGSGQQIVHDGPAQVTSRRCVMMVMDQVKSKSIWYNKSCAIIP